MFEQYLDSPAAIWTIFFLTAAVTGAVVDGAGRLIWRFKDLGRSWIVTVPETPGAFATVERAKPLRGTITRKHPNSEEKETFILSGDSAFPTLRGPLHLISAYGANLVAPTKDEAVDAKTGKALKSMFTEETDPTTGEKVKVAKTYLRFRVWDPLVYWRATRENDMEDLYSAQKERDHWAVKLAPVAIIMFIGLMGFLAFLLWKIMPLVQAAG